MIKNAMMLRNEESPNGNIIEHVMNISFDQLKDLGIKWDELSKINDYLKQHLPANAEVVGIYQEAHHDDKYIHTVTKYKITEKV